MITGNSRYVNDILTVITGLDGNDRTTIVQPEPEASTFNYITHSVSGFERIDEISYAYLGDVTQWWQIANVNPEIMYWDNLAPGITIRIPQ